MRFLSTIFYMVLTIAALNFFFLLSLVGYQYFSGQVKADDLLGMLRILGGNQRVIMPSAEFDRYQEYLKDEEKVRAELDQKRGQPMTRETVDMRVKESEQVLRENLDVVNKLLVDEKKRVEDVRKEVEARKTEVQGLKKALDEEKLKNAMVEKDAVTAKLRKTLAEMDAGDIATYLSEIIRDPSQGGPVEAARIVRDHLKADYSAEVLGEMRPEDRQKILPLLENKYAGVPPEAVVSMFKTQKMSPGEELGYLLQMNPQQALGVYLRLPEADREQMAPKLLNPKP